jgi:hypothetical protein
MIQIIPQMRILRVFSARVRSAKFFAMASGFHESEKSIAGRWLLRADGVRQG